MHLLRPTLSVELINTDADEDDEDDGGGGGDTSSSTMVQLSKWSEYVEKYANVSRFHLNAYRSSFCTDDGAFKNLNESNANRRKKRKTGWWLF